MNKRETAGEFSAKRHRPLAYVFLYRLTASVVCAGFLIGTTPAPLRAQESATPDYAAPQDYSKEQLDALLAPIALYPDDLLVQVLMASAYPLDIVAAARWVKDPANQALQGDALTQALAQQSWDPSVKSLVPFPQVLEMMSDQLDWTQQLGYAMDVQQSDVMASIQRLRRQAEIAGQLKSTEYQTVSTEGGTIVIAPAQPNVVYVPVYNPTVVYGTWPYPAYPPVYLPPPPGYAVGTALLTGLAFGAGIALTAGLWGWASPNWGYGNVHVNVNRYNTINVNRPPINNSNWRPNGGYSPAGGYRPPASGPVGRPGGPTALPASAAGRPPSGAARPPAGGTRPPVSQGGNASRPTGGQGASSGGKKPAVQQPAARPANGTRPPVSQGGNATRPGGGQGASNSGKKPAVQQPAARPASGTRPPVSQGGNATRPNSGQGAPSVGNKPAARPAPNQGKRPQAGQGGNARPGGGQGGSRLGN